jgi:hypothetical protein
MGEKNGTLVRDGNFEMGGCRKNKTIPTERKKRMRCKHKDEGKLFQYEMVIHK